MYKRMGFLKTPTPQLRYTAAVPRIARLNKNILCVAAARTETRYFRISQKEYESVSGFHSHRRNYEIMQR